VQAIKLFLFLSAAALFEAEYDWLARESRVFGRELLLA
jgi:hypothetical protein